MWEGKQKPEPQTLEDEEEEDAEEEEEADEFDDFAEEGEDDFGDFDEADETPIPQPEAIPQTELPDPLAGLVSGKL